MPARVAVVIPTFNTAELVTQAVESVLAQSFRDLSIVVVDDGSTDETGSVLRSRFGTHPRVSLAHQANLGPAAARNLGIRSSRGELVAFLDSDDLWLPEKLELQVRQLDAHPEAAAVFCDVSIRGDGDPHMTRFMRKGYRGDTSLRGILEADFPGCTPSLLLRRSVLEAAGGFDESLPCNEDWDLWIRIVSRHPVVCLPQPLAIIRARPESVSRSGRLENRISELRLWRRHEAALRAAGLPRALIRNRVARSHRIAGQTLRSLGRYAEARSHYRAWWQLKPWQVRPLFMRLWLGLAARLRHAPSTRVTN